MSEVTVPVMRIFPERDLDLPLPAYVSAGAAGMDLAAALEREVALAPGEIQLIPTGLALAIPAGFEGQIRPRSGLALKYGITLINSPGTIDSDYRGEIGLPVINLGPRPYTIRRGERLAQLVIQRIYRANLQETDRLKSTERGQGGFGHSGA